MVWWETGIQNKRMVEVCAGREGGGGLKQYRWLCHEVGAMGAMGDYKTEDDEGMCWEEREGD
jgi:hypothetical protein